MEKYYQPKIEEFYDSFEFEMKSNTYHKCFNVQILNQWFTEEFCYWFDDTGESTYHDVTKGIEEGNVRVKHLDRDCIESLGWEYVHHNNANTDRWHDVHKKGSLLMISGGVSEGLVIREDDKMGTRLFIGTIKNKSELKRLLNQLGI